MRKAAEWIKGLFQGLQPWSPQAPDAAYQSVLSRINERRDALREQDDSYLQAIVQRLTGETFSPELTAEAMALAAVMSERILGLRLFDVQLIGALAMADGKIAEMQTGEGKTLAAVPAVYVHTLACGGTHVLTANDYLAKRDAAWMGDIYRSLGLSVSYINQGMSAGERRQAYACHVVYATPNEVGFDLLRDQLCLRPDELVHKPFRCALFDEADSILIDEARIPLVIAGGDAAPGDIASDCAALARRLQPKIHYRIDEFARNVLLTDRGIRAVEQSLYCRNLYESRNALTLAAIQDALHAEVLLRRDVDYIVKNDVIELVDEFKGRVAENRRWPAGLQTAIEAKENLPLKKQGRILGSITLQNLAALYPRKCGMTGTAATQAAEFFQIYKLEVAVIPTNRPVIRIDHPDMIFRTREEKERALIEEIRNVHATGRPILVGTASVAESERLSASLKNSGIPHHVLNARNNELEAQIIAQAGASGAVTISTNMAGRGTDIPVGGTPPGKRDRILELGGLYVIGTNRHESRRIDHQLRGRAGRQGEAGSSRFFISLEDDLMERFGIRKAMQNDMPEEKAIEHVQKIIEGQNLEIRRTLEKYEQIIEQQRKIIQAMRSETLAGESESLLESGEPELYERLCGQFGKECIDEQERLITLTKIDELWPDYLVDIAELRSGIHWVSLGGNDPLNEYLRQVALKFENLRDRIDEQVLAELEKLQPDENGQWPELPRFDRGATWTYVINDQPFGNMSERFMKNLVARIRLVMGKDKTPRIL
ncbi:MAG: accessory Sec system translocase SecA2 [Acidobacteria bacterium]|nr:accessory Sec system translocase SecA2 [Acidobacteriota bacterium]